MHALALGESKTHFSTDAVLSGEATGQAIDLRIATLTPATTREELLALLHAIGSAERSAGPWPEVTRWADGHYATIRLHARTHLDGDGLGIWST